jgi:hypothetical protein
MAKVVFESGYWFNFEWPSLPEFSSALAFLGDMTEGAGALPVAGWYLLLPRLLA